MPLTRVQVEAYLIHRAGGNRTGPYGWMKAAQLDTSPSGANADLNEPLWAACKSVGVNPTDPSAVADADLALIPSGRELEFVAIADAFNCEAILAVLGSIPDQQRAPDYIFFSQMAKSLAAAITGKWQTIKTRYRIGRAETIVGRMALGPNPPDVIRLPVVAEQLRAT